MQILFLQNFYLGKTLSHKTMKKRGNSQFKLARLIVTKAYFSLK